MDSIAPALPVDEMKIRDRLTSYLKGGLRIFATSSFQTNSVVLLHLLSRFAPEVPVYFLDTGYHFPETLAFRNQLAKELELQVVTLRSPITRILQRDRTGSLLFRSDPDLCCHLNKVLPLEPVILKSDVWVSGVRRDQSTIRAALGEEVRGRHGILRYHPLIDWRKHRVEDYIRTHDLPRHPLEAQGYLSVGCQPCTRSALGEHAAEDNGCRGGRWPGMQKTECGLHLGIRTGNEVDS